VTEEGIADERDTLDYLLARAKRDAVPVRHAFVHDPRTGGGPGPLARLMRRPETLDLYLLLLAIAVKKPHNVQYPLAVYGRALGRGDGKSAELWVSKSLRWLEDAGLIRRTKVGRELEITLREDSSRRRAYKRPTTGDRSDWFFNLSHAYFLDGWHKRLSAPAKAVLLVSHCNEPGFELNQRRGEIWWGLSGDTLGRGLIELQDVGVLSARPIKRKAPAARTGYTLVPLYTLLPPFAKGTPGTRPKKTGRRRSGRKGARPKVAK
jgi:hypothetical protein